MWGCFSKDKKRGEREGRREGEGRGRGREGEEEERKEALLRKNVKPLRQSGAGNERHMVENEVAL